MIIAVIETKMFAVIGSAKTEELIQLGHVMVSHFKEDISVKQQIQQLMKKNVIERSFVQLNVEIPNQILLMIFISQTYQFHQQTQTLIKTHQYVEIGR